MTINYSLSPFLCPIFGGCGSAGGNTGYALDSNFTLGTAGDCVGIRFLAPIGNVHIHSVYFFLHAANSTSHDLICHVANYGGSTTRAGTDIRSVTSEGGTTAGKWIKFDFSAYSDALTENEFYWLVVGDTTGSGSGYQIRTRNSSHTTNSSTSAITSVGILNSMFVNDSGFTTNGTAQSYPVGFIIIFSDGRIIGNPYTQSVLSANNSLERGLKFIFDEKIICNGTFFVANTNFSTLQIYSGSTSPNGTVWSGFNSGSSYTLSTNIKTIGAALFPSPVTFEKNTVYRITFKSSSSNNGIGYNEVEDFSTPGADALACALGAGSWCYTIDNGAGGWTDYDNVTDGIRLARISLIMQSQVGIPTGGSYSFGI